MSRLDASNFRKALKILEEVRFFNTLRTAGRKGAEPVRRFEQALSISGANKLRASADESCNLLQALASPPVRSATKGAILSKSERGGRRLFPCAAKSFARMASG